MHYYIDVLKKYAVFEGRAARKEYWMFVLFNFIIAMAFWIIGFAMHSLILYWLYLLATIVPSLAVGVRRLHDTDRRGWWLLIGFVPFVGAIILLVCLVSDSEHGANRFGPNPKGM